MEDRKANVIGCSIIVLLILIIAGSHFFFKHHRAFFLILGAGITIIFAVFSCLVIRSCNNRRRKSLEARFSRERRELRVDYSFLRKVAGVPIKFKYKELEDATDNFRSLVGRGASGSVYKGTLSDGTVVAVKRIDGQDRGEKQFRSEVAAIASVQHVNLARLIGYSSAATGPRFLVYEFIPSGSLDCWIFPRRGTSGSVKPGGCLSWDLRRVVAIDVAKALSYLHHDCRSRVLHLDVKPENILLDQNNRAIVCDFGLSKLMGRDESTIITTIRGTRGYLAPEWILERGVSEKCDVYSFGMVLLEMIGGRRCIGSRKESKSQRKLLYFPNIVIEKMKQEKLMEIVDPRLLEGGGIEIDEKDVRRLVYVALWCIQDRARNRPSMDLVVEMLEGRVSVDEPPDFQMVMVDLLSMDEEQLNGFQKPKFTTIKLHDEDSQSHPPLSHYTSAVTDLSGR